MQDVGNNGFIHSVPSLQHALGQICHGAAIAELQQGEQTHKGENNERKLTMSQHTLCLYNMSNSGRDVQDFHAGKTAQSETFWS